MLMKTGIFWGNYSMRDEGYSLAGYFTWSWLTNLSVLVENRRNP